APGAFCVGTRPLKRVARRPPTAYPPVSGLGPPPSTSPQEELPMPAPSARHCFEWDEVGDVTVVRFTVRSIRADEVINRTFAEVNQLVEAGRTRLVLDFGAVQDFASLTIGKLIALHRRLRPLEG